MNSSLPTAAHIQVQALLTVLRRIFLMAFDVPYARSCRNKLLRAGGISPGVTVVKPLVKGLGYVLAGALIVGAVTLQDMHKLQEVDRQQARTFNKRQRETKT